MCEFYKDPSLNINVTMIAQEVLDALKEKLGDTAIKKS